MEDIKKKREEMPFNFKLWLMESFVRINDWENLDIIFTGIYDQRLDLTLHKFLLQALLDALNWFIDPLYQ